MVRKITAIGGALLLTLLLCVSAAAAGLTTVTLSEGQYVRVLLPMPDGATLREHEIVSGDVAPGMVLRAEGEGLALVGAPKELGNWIVTVRCRTDAGAFELVIEQYVELPPKAALPAATATPEPTAEPEPTEAAAEEPETTPEPEGTPVPTLAPSEDAPDIIKSPTGETVSEGGTAIFVAQAENAVEAQWYLADPTGGEPKPVADAAMRFPGLRIYGADTNTLSLSGISADMDGWQAECRFTGHTGAVANSGRALISVKKGLSAPILVESPKDTDLYRGEETTLTVSAVPPDEAELHYQWYSANSYDLAVVRPIEGAQEASYTPPFREGTVYYCVSVRSAIGGEESTGAFSDLAAVTCRDQVRQHVHAYEAWAMDERDHWLACECGQRQDQSAHELEWTVLRKPTAQREGERRGVCGICGYGVTESVPAAGRPIWLRAVLAVVLLMVAAALFVGSWRVLCNSKKNKTVVPRSGSYHGSHERQK